MSLEPDAREVNSRLPHDIERTIFETAIFMHPTCAPSLLQTARRVQSWIEPLVFKTLVLSGRNVDAHLWAALFTKPPAFFAQHTRHVFVGKGLPDDDVQLVVSRCAAAESFVFEAKWRPTTFPDIWRLPQLQRLTLSFRLVRIAAVPGPGSGPAILPNLTHLTLYPAHQTDAESTGRYLAFLAALPRLTHLCVCMVQDEGFLHHILNQCPRLQVLLHVFDAGMYTREDYIRDMAALHDPRCVLLDLTRHYLDWTEWALQDWRLAAAGGVELLARAARFVAGKNGSPEGRLEFLWEDPHRPPEDSDALPVGESVDGASV
ncbi:hypothetical protein MIND_00963800 [Mycena indigotica]|uniref:Uncharacterized protein n=1 Tax=Mycena indigotica TaxID=2126181 RepID=A0A8H6SD24_9AGAR|nr:uncharacterized protein MIND_00963800 [Mycena indigotica]KAF7297306.1 hypothetical protein MIND_00963800 [Mycena indigotica]